MTILWKWYVWLGGRLRYFHLFYAYFLRSTRVRVVVLTKDRRALLVRNWYGNQNWTLPGGGIKRGESERDAAVRELKEETGVVATINELHYIGQYGCHESRVVFEAKCYYTLIDSAVDLLSTKNREIIDRKWFQLDDLPSELGLDVDKIVKNIS